MAGVARSLEMSGETLANLSRQSRNGQALVDHQFTQLISVPRRLKEDYWGRAHWNSSNGILAVDCVRDGQPQIQENVLNYIGCDNVDRHPVALATPARQNSRNVGALGLLAQHHGNYRND